VRKPIGIVTAAALAAALLAAGSAGAAPVITPFGGWSWGSPRPQGETLNAIGAGGAGTYAVGDFGTLLRSTDGGHAWSGIRTATRTDLTHVSVVDKTTFVAAGGCLLLRSGDAGRTIRRGRIPCSAPIVALDFPTRADGYVVLADRSVVSLTSGLSSLSGARVPAAGGPPNDIACTGSDTCVVATGSGATGRIYRTKHGGFGWKTAYSGRGVRDVFFVSATTGYAVGDGVALKTDDGGVTWTQRPPPHRTLVEVSCGDALHCVVVGRSHVVLYTADGFNTLNQSHRVDDITAPVFENTAAFTSANHVVAAGKGGYTWTSDDGGLGFDKGYISPFVVDGLATGRGAADYAFGPKGLLRRSDDGGATWQRLTRIPTSRTIVGWWVPELYGALMAIDKGGFLFQSTDGGGSWSALGRASPADPHALWCTCGDPGGDIVLVGGRFGLRRSTDGGAHFTKVLGRRIDVIQATKSGDGTVNLMGTRSLLRTDDGGAPFDELAWPSNRRLADVQFLTSKLGFALTRDGRLWRTDDAGGRWRELLGVGARVGPAIDFIRNDDGSISGSVTVRGFGGSGRGFGWVLHTSDGGASWRPQLIADEPIRDVAFSRFAARMIALAGPRYLFWTLTGGDAAKASALSIHKRPTAAGRLRVVGRLTAHLGKQKVVVSWRRPPSAKWHAEVVRTNKRGTYHWTAPDDGRRYTVVAQWAGNPKYRGAGSKPGSWHPPQ
jgi:photosystem II stability/assembly factor-like uncharacterized protein